VVFLVLFAPACATLRGGDRVDPIEGGEVQCLASESSDAGRLRIAVVDGLGAPVSQAAVTVRRLSAEAVFSIVADDSGHLRIEHLLPGAYRVEVALEGVPRGFREAVPVRAGCTTSVTVPVAPKG
jgi:hypothetical protein